MQPHIVSRVDPGTLVLFKIVRDYVDMIPERVRNADGDIKLTSHNIVQALAHEFRTLKPVHGYFDSSTEHAWLQTSDPDWIIDPYPIYVLGGPMLIYMSTSAMSPWCRIYDSERRPTAFDKPGLLDEVNAIVEAVYDIRFRAMP